MEKFTGQCVGGPHDGQMLAHWAKSKEFLRPMMAPTFPMSERAPIMSIKIGEYRLNDFGQWHWWETPEGKAWNVLHQ